MKQSKIMSLVESVINIAIGFGISLAAQMYFLPLLGVIISFQQNLLFALIMTVISIARSYLLRRLFEAMHIRRPLSPFMQAVIAERFRQIEQEGWSTTHDDAHPVGELAAAGSSYAIMPTWRRRADESFGPKPPIAWPWSLDWWKPQDNRRDLVRAAALVVAEGEKLDRNRGRK
ncbi:DUF7220 family protein [Bradyrhizobium sp. CCBAU 11357]|uniref:DUF7220 family protein n=1 Tax=Bradyrhizobium sp. CCBAU 11357 TaxID=1630808 RepID=UPI00230492DE|nr:hypothetical protein [Bradyrhizobium sp. CCBAU 11357]MDA9499296.1 hypothetical protein [Bradyrhizobium sp. CCBAU 11357]